MADVTSMQIPSALWEKLTSLQMPTQGEFVKELSELGAVPAAVLVACGIGSLFWGWKIFKCLVVGNAAYLGFAVGCRLGAMLPGERMPLFGGIGGGLLLGALACPLINPAVSVMGALAGGLMGYGVWHHAAGALGKPELVQYAWAGGLIGLVTLGLLAFLILKKVVMVFTAFQGAMMAVSGTLALCLRYEPISQNLRAALVNNAHLLSLLIIVPTLIGFASQYSTTFKKEKKKKKAAEGD